MDADRALHLPQLLQRTHAEVDLPQRRRHAFIEQLTVGIELEPPARAGKKRLSQLLLEPGDDAAERGLCHKKPLRCGRDRPGLRHGRKAPELMKFHL